jgi:CBS-domain-containing membrane protein
MDTWDRSHWFWLGAIGMRQIKEVMTTRVVTVTPSTPFKEAVEVLAAYKVAAAPVVDEDGWVVGVVSEADLLLKEEYPRDQEPRMGERLRHRADQGRSRGTVVRDFMTSPAVVIAQDATVRHAARLLHAKHVKRLPVIDERGRLVGIVSRGDLLRGYLRSDQQILEEIREDVIGRRMLTDPGRFVVHVDDGVVTLEGRCERRSLAPILVRLVYSVEGVVHVDPRLSWDLDDTPRPRSEVDYLGP